MDVMDVVDATIDVIPGIPVAAVEVTGITAVAAAVEITTITAGSVRHTAEGLQRDTAEATMKVSVRASGLPTAATASCRSMPA